MSGTFSECLVLTLLKRNLGDVHDRRSQNGSLFLSATWIQLTRGRMKYVDESPIHMKDIIFIDHQNVTSAQSTCESSRADSR